MLCRLLKSFSDVVQLIVAGDFSCIYTVNYRTLFNKLLDDNVNCKIARILAAWYNTQTCSVKWGGVTFMSFRIVSGTWQGGVLPTYLFARYIRELLGSVRNTDWVFCW